MEQFCLLSYEDPEVSIPFLDDESSNRNGPHVSIVIGPNGSGKSRTLSRVVDELCYLRACRDSDNSAMTRFRPASNKAVIRYRLNGARCEISRGDYGIQCTLDGKTTSLAAILFPERVATVSHLPTDKFRFARSEASDFYRYLGLRQATNLTTTGALEAKVVQSLIVGFTVKGFAEKLRAWLSLGGMTEDVGIAITLSTEKLLEVRYEGFKEIAMKAAERRVGSARVSTFEASESWTKDLDSMWRLISELRHLHWSTSSKAPSVTLDLERFMAGPVDAQALAEGFDAARRWKLFRDTSLVLGKEGGRYPFSDLSSGEQQLIGTSARLLAELKPNALVVIDEPEISLHPDWQIKYVHTLLQTLRASPATHVVIATHSHFMVSDLDSRNSALIMSSYDQGPKFKQFDGEVYGRSPENILYRVFGVATTGNSNVEADLFASLQMLSNAVPLDGDELQKIYGRLSRVRGADNSAMNLILDRVQAALEKPE